LGKVQRNRPLHKWFLSVGEGTNEQHDGLEYTMALCNWVKFGGSTAQEGLEDLLDAMDQVALSLSQDHTPASERG
jgi:hypothetical protein